MNENIPLSKHESLILRELRLSGSCSINELAELLSVSDETVRRHVQPLVKKGLAHRVHGGIVLAEQEAPFQRRLEENRKPKQRIAKLTAQMIQHGDSLFIDNGATTHHVAEALIHHRNLTIVTNSIGVAATLAMRNDNKVYMAGGSLRADDAASFGKAVVEFIEQFDVKYGILSTGSMNTAGQFFNFHLEEAEISQAAIQCSEHIIMVADNSKLNRKGLVKACDFDDIDTLITDQMPTDELLERARQNDTEVQVAPE